MRNLFLLVVFFFICLCSCSSSKTSASSSSFLKKEPAPTGLGHSLNFGEGWLTDQSLWKPTEWICHGEYFRVDEEKDNVIYIEEGSLLQYRYIAKEGSEQANRLCMPGTAALHLTEHYRDLGDGKKHSFRSWLAGVPKEDNSQYEKGILDVVFEINLFDPSDSKDPSFQFYILEGPLGYIPIKCEEKE